MTILVVVSDTLRLRVGERNIGKRNRSVSIDIPISASVYSCELTNIQESKNEEAQLYEYIYGKLLACHTTYRFITAMPHHLSTIYSHATPLFALTLHT
jgi:hypothetical protein